MPNKILPVQHPMPRHNYIVKWAKLTNLCPKSHYTYQTLFEIINILMILDNGQKEKQWASWRKWRCKIFYVFKKFDQKGKKIWKKLEKCQKMRKKCQNCQNFIQKARFDFQLPDIFLYCQKPPNLAVKSASWQPCSKNYKKKEGVSFSWCELLKKFTKKWD